MMKNRVLTAILCFFTVILIITFSIGLPIYCRPFYYMQIDSLGVVEATGYDKATIKTAYDELLDYLTIPDKNFSTGVFSYSESGKSHFEDCKALFDLNITMFLISLAVVILLNILKRKGIFKPVYLRGHHYTFVCGAATLSLFALIGIAASINFEKAFVVFHKIFFPGKDNWIFSTTEDEIIKALPEEFFMNCAVLILLSIVIISLILIIFSFIRKINSRT